MSGEKNLETLLRSLTTELIEGTFVFVTVRDEAVPQGIVPRMMFREAEGTTLVLLKTEAEKYNLPFEFPCRMITLNIHSSLEAVGFIARIASELAKEGIGANPVSAFFHDHVFVPDGREADAICVLNRIAASEIDRS